MRRTLLFLVLLLVFSGGEARAHGGEEWIKVKKVYDGDTLELAGDMKVRLIGIDAPELHSNDKLYHDVHRTHQDAKTILKMGKASYEVFKKLVGKQKVRLEYDETSRDKYGRTLAYVYVRLKEDRFDEIMHLPFKGRKAVEREYMLNREMIRYGWASAFRNFVYRYKEEFFELEKQARDEGRGLWRSSRTL